MLHTYYHFFCIFASSVIELYGCITTFFDCPASHSSFCCCCCINLRDEKLNSESMIYSYASKKTVQNLKKNQKREKPNQKIIIITVKNQLNGRVFSFHSFCHKFMNWKHFFLSTFVYFYSMSILQFSVCLKFNKNSWLNRKKRENYFTKICQKNSRYHLNSIKCKRFRCVSVYVHKIGRINGRF